MSIQFSVAASIFLDLPLLFESIHRFAFVHETFSLSLSLSLSIYLYTSDTLSRVSSFRAPSEKRVLAARARGRRAIFVKSAAPVRSIAVEVSLVRRRRTSSRFIKPRPLSLTLLRVVRLVIIPLPAGWFPRQACVPATFRPPCCHTLRSKTRDLRLTGWTESFDPLSLLWSFPNVLPPGFCLAADDLGWYCLTGWSRTRKTVRIGIIRGFVGVSVKIIYIYIYIYVRVFF